MTVTTTQTPAEVDAIFRRLRALKASFGRKPNKDELATLLIGACISEGFDTEPRVIGTLKLLGLPPSHVRAVLRFRGGNDTAITLWKLSDVGRLALFD